MKVFCCGLPRTGTRSLLCGLQVLGLTTVHVKHQAHVGWEDADAFADTPVWSDYKRLDKEFPDAKFILSVREPHSWYRSFERTLGQLYQVTVGPDTNPRKQTLYSDDVRCYKSVFGTTPLQEGPMVKVYKKHKTTVLKYFRPKRGKLIVIDVSKPGALVELSKFLQLLPKNFPNMNKISRVQI